MPTIGLEMTKQTLGEFKMNFSFVMKKASVVSGWVGLALFLQGLPAKAQSKLVNKNAEYALSTCKNSQPWALVCRGNTEKMMQTSTLQSKRVWEGENQIVVCQTREGKLDLRTLVRPDGNSEFPKDQTTHGVVSQLNDRGEADGFLIETRAGIAGTKYFYNFEFPKAHQDSEIKVTIRTAKWGSEKESKLICNRIGYWDDITQKKFLAAVPVSQNPALRRQDPAEPIEDAGRFLKARGSKP